MATGANKDRIIGGVGVAVAAHLRPVVRLRKPGVVKGCAGPTSRDSVTRLAGGREPRCLMARIGRRGVIRFVTGITIRRRTRVFASDVAQSACHRRVGAHQWERRRVVIERRRLPGRGVVAQGAILREARGHVVRIVAGIGVIRQMTGNTCRRKAIIFAARMASRALKGSVETCQGERCPCGVIERGPGPGSGGVAARAICRKPCG